MTTSAITTKETIRRICWISGVMLPEQCYTDITFANSHLSQPPDIVLSLKFHHNDKRACYSATNLLVTITSL
jgi:hypothetical protein